jgi:plasmid maintenance system killer protein
MKITFKNTKDFKAVSDIKIAKKHYGDLASKILKMLGLLSSAKNLKDISNLQSTGFHELIGDFKGHYAVSLNGNFRMIFIADIDTSSSFTLEQIKEIKVIHIKIDYHKK